MYFENMKFHVVSQEVLNLNIQKQTNGESGFIVYLICIEVVRDNKRPVQAKHIPI